MPGHDIIVISASAGGMEALTQLAFEPVKEKEADVQMRWRRNQKSICGGSF